MREGSGYVLGEQQVTDVVEEYLETIYRLQEKEGDGAKTNEIVKVLNVVPGTVTNTIERLEKEGLVEHEPYRGVKLTEKGRRIAVQVLRRHRLSERLLTDILHLDWGKAHDAACKIEHVINDEEIIESLEKALGYPKTCPHGNPIPAKEDRLEEHTETTESTPLWTLNPSQAGTIEMITEEDTEMLQYLSRLGIVPGVSVQVLKKESSDGVVTIRLQESTVQTISEKAASVVKVKVRGATQKKEKRMAVKVESKPNRIATYAEYER
jgi:DtxR family Mn-dependent transcriptional regulator